MDVDIRKPVTHEFGIERRGESTNYSTSDDGHDNDDDTTEDENASESDHSVTLQDEDDEGFEQGHRRLRVAWDAMEQHAMDREEDFPQHTGNELDIEERIAAMPLVHPDDHPIYDSEEEDEEDDMEEARRIGGWRYRSKVLKNHIVLAGSYVADFLRKISPIPKSTPMPRSKGTLDSTATLVEAKRFKAPKGKRE